MELLVPLVIGQILRITGYVAAIALVSVVMNLIHQLFFYKHNEPPVVFHLFPFIGSTVSYGMDPYKFFFSSREKVRGDRLGFEAVDKAYTNLVRRYLHFHLTRQENHSLSRDRGKRIHPEWKTQGCQRRRSLRQADNTRLRLRRGLRLFQLQTDGAEESKNRIHLHQGPN